MDSTTAKRFGSQKWSRRISGEPALSQVLSDPIIVMLMRRDRVRYVELQDLMDRMRQSMRPATTLAA